MTRLVALATVIGLTYGGSLHYTSHLPRLDASADFSGMPLPTPAPLDTLVDVGGHRLHFKVWKGQYPAILFESGGGDDLTVWNKLIAPLYQATGATIVTYDRAGFGKSELDGTRMRLNQQVEDLKKGLDKLPVGKSYVVVSHSFGGFFATLFAAMYKSRVKGAVYLDASHVSYYTDARLQHFEKEYGALKAQFKEAEPGKYWMLQNAWLDRNDMRKAPLPATIPAVDILAERPATNSAEDLALWQAAHRQFVAAAPNRRLVTASGSGHYVMNDKPELVLETIAQVYRSAQPKASTAGN